MIIDFITEAIGWPTAIAGFMAAITYSSLMLIREERRKDIGSWLSGVGFAKSWPDKFHTIFKAIFTDKHISLRCFFASSFVSLLTLSILWVWLQDNGFLSDRLQSEIGFSRLLVISLVVNIVADYFSLYETRLLISRMPRKLLLQFFVICLDLIISALIVISILYIYKNTPLRELEFVTPSGLWETVRDGQFWNKLQFSVRDTVYISFLDILVECVGFYSVYSILFLTTFVTSVWLWLFVASSAALRTFSNRRISWLFDPERRPAFYLSYFVFVISLIVLIPVHWLAESTADQVRRWDLYLCDLSQGSSCVRAAKLTTNRDELNRLFSSACGVDIDYAGLPFSSRQLDVHSACTQYAIRAREYGLLREEIEILENLYERGYRTEILSNNLAYAYLSRRGSGDAELQAAEFLVRPFWESESAAVQDTIGIIYMRQRNLEEAITRFERANELSRGRDRDIIFHLGQTYDFVGRTSDAHEQFQLISRRFRSTSANALSQLYRIGGWMAINGYCLDAHRIFDDTVRQSMDIVERLRSDTSALVGRNALAQWESFIDDVAKSKKSLKCDGPR